MDFINEYYNRLIGWYQEMIDRLQVWHLLYLQIKTHH